MYIKAQDKTDTKKGKKFMKSTKTLRLGMAVLLILATLSQLFLSASADTFEDDYISYRSKVDAIDNSALRNTVQLHRLDQNYRKIRYVQSLLHGNTAESQGGI